MILGLPIMGDPQIQEINDTASPGLRVLLDVTKTPERRFWATV